MGTEENQQPTPQAPPLPPTPAAAEPQPPAAAPVAPVAPAPEQPQAPAPAAAPAEPQPPAAAPVAPVAPAPEQPQAPAPAAAPVEPTPAEQAGIVQQPGAASQGSVGMPAQPVAAPELERPANVPDSWPFEGYDGPQPWEVEDPPALTHDRGLVTSGAAGGLVTELAACLAHLGIGTAISEGKNPHMIYGPAEEAGIAEFRRVFGVEEDPEIVRAAGDGVVGPWTWEALFRAVKQKAGD
jgi:peptidoglycan hydrolase-like protein with peptidoglycan-binding domain